ncbi:hypothetical protein AVEN_13112-1 [Araneus ventricosus]|uniref:Uncharacterized protein n=1 Tax=Araneus ventricosus TaxID=182803 RepID=A0A4Y2PEZ3_ARAVE|nr:hypothetical protein AVEN_13112-1 [Araneus ventricosus]
MKGDRSSHMIERNIDNKRRRCENCTSQAIFNVLDKVYVRTDVTDEGSYFSRGKESNLIRTVGVTLERNTGKKSCRRMLYMLSLDLLERVDSLTL